MTKKCNVCKINKPLEDYHKSKKYKDGLAYRCRGCAMIATKKWKKENIERKRLLSLRYERSEKGILARKKRIAKKPKGFGNQYQYEWIKKYPEKSSAYGKVQRALKSGKLIKQPCLKCGCEKVEAHHEDYSRPLDVMWLCRKCHAQIHRIYK